jgi:hypothetical protein
MTKIACHHDRSKFLSDTEATVVVKRRPNKKSWERTEKARDFLPLAPTSFYRQPYLYFLQSRDETPGSIGRKDRNRVPQETDQVLLSRKPYPAVQHEMDVK